MKNLIIGAALLLSAVIIAAPVAPGSTDAPTPMPSGDKPADAPSGNPPAIGPDRPAQSAPPMPGPGIKLFTYSSCIRLESLSDAQAICPIICGKKGKAWEGKFRLWNAGVRTTRLSLFNYSSCTCR